MRLSELNCFRRESVKPVETCQRAKEIEEAMEFNEVMQALRKQKNEKLAERGDEIESLKMEMGKFRRSSLADKEVIDDLYRQIEDKNIVVREHDNLIKELRQKEQTIEDLKRQNSAKEKEEKEKIHRLGHEIDDKNIKLHQVNQQIEQEDAEISDLKKQNAIKEQTNFADRMIIDRLKQAIDDKESELRDHDALKQKLREKDHEIADLTRKSAAEQRLSANQLDADKVEIEKLKKEIAANEEVLEKYNDKLGRREQKITGLKQKKEENRRLSLADKCTIDHLWTEIAEKNDKIKDHDELLEELKKRENENATLRQHHRADKKEIDRLNQVVKDREIAAEEITGGLGGIFITTKQFRVSMRCGVYLDTLVKKVQAMNGFEAGIWEKGRTVCGNDRSGEIELWFNYLGDDIMSFSGVQKLITLLRRDQYVLNVKIEDQKYVNGASQ